MPTDLQVRTVEAIVNVFETGRVLGDYAKITLIPGDTGQLTYGRSQTTLTSGGLHALVCAYCNADDARFAADLRGFLLPLEEADPALNHTVFFHNLLRAAGDDPAMRTTQDRFFANRYFRPAVTGAEESGIETPLGVAVVYDSWVHGSWRAMRDRTTGAVGAVADVGEEAWVSAYVDTRREWLATHRRSDLRATTYRMDAFRALIDLDLWQLELPIVVRGLEISDDTLDDHPDGVYTGPPPRSRTLELVRPIQRGLDVRLLQLALSRPGRDVDVVADGLFGPATRAAVTSFQGDHGLPVTGSVDADLFDLLEV